MKRRIGLVAGLALLLAACGGNGGDSYANKQDYAVGAAPPMAPPPPPSPVMEQSAQSAPGDATRARFDQDGGGGGGQPAGEPVEPAEARQIAYTYYYGFAVPTAQMEGLLNAHKAACESAGPSVCYVSNSSINGLGEEYASGSLQVRASQAWVESFMAGMAEGLKPFGAALSSSNTSAEDLTTQIIDTTATLNSAKTLRERLQALLADRPGKLSDLLEIERELARVQQQIDSTESWLAAMKLRVLMSTMTFNYEPRYSAVSESIWRPLGESFDNIAPNIARSLAGIVEFISSILVWVLLAGGVIWLVVWRLGRKAKPAPPAPVAAGSPKST